MSVATLLRRLTDKGATVEHAIVAVSALEHAHAKGVVGQLIGRLQEIGASPQVIGIAAEAVTEARLAAHAVPRDHHSGKKDSNRSRRSINGVEWRRLREVVFERDGARCAYCGATDDLTVDHIVPLFRGGGNDLHNLTPACRPCNSSKGGKLLSEWEGRA